MNWTHLWPLTSRQRRARQPGSFRPAFESLERRDQPAAFTAGNIAVLQVDAAGTSNSSFRIVELDPSLASQTPTNIIIIDGTGPNAMRISGSATSTGYLAMTNDGSLIAFNAINTTNTSSNVNSLNPRAVGTVDAAGNFVIQTTYNGTLSGNPQTRSSTSLDNVTWYIADQAGLYTNDAIAPSPTGNLRGIKSFGGIVYVGQQSSSGANVQVSSVSAPSGGTITGLTGLTNNNQFQDFYLISSGDNGADFDILYVVSNSGAAAGTITKFSLVAGEWVANGSYTTTFGGFGLAAADSGSGAVLFVSTGNGSTAANRVEKLTDTGGYNETINISSVTTLYTAPTGTTIKGVAFAPLPASDINVLPATYSTNEDSAKVLDGISIDDPSAVGDITVTFSVTSGTLSLSEIVGGGVIGSQITGNGTSSVIVTATVAAINATLADGNGLTFTPDLNFSGPVTLTMATTGGTEDDTDLSAITVIAVNDAPAISVPGAQTTDEDVARVFSSGNGNAITIADVDAGSSSVEVTLTATNGTVALSTVAGLTFTAGSNGSAAMTFTGTLANINAALEGLSFGPTANFSGPASLQIDVDDQGHTGSGGALTDSKTINITVNAVNDPPVNTVPAGPLSVIEDGSLVITGLAVADVDAGSNNVQVTLSVLHGILTISDTVSGGLGAGEMSGNGTATVVITSTLAKINATFADAAGVTYEPNAAYVGPDTLIMATNDLGNSGGPAETDTDNVGINVNSAGTNLPPTNVLPGTLSATEDVVSTLAGISVSDPDAGILNLQVTFSVASGILTVTTTGISGGVTAGQVSGNGTSAVTITAPQDAINATLAAANGLQYLSAPNGNGAVTLIMITNDLGNSGLIGGPQADIDFTTINVAAVNDAPVNSVPGTQTTPEDTALVFSAGNGNLISISDVDAGSNPVQVTLTATNGTVTLSGTSGLGFSVGDGTADATMTFTGTIANINAALNGLTFNPTANFAGAASLQIVTNDQGNTGTGGALSDTDTVNINVTAVNDGPTNTVPAGVQTTSEDTTLVFTGGTAISISDPDAGTSSVQVTLIATNGTVTLSGTSGLTFLVGTGTANAAMTFTGTIASINTALNNLTFNPTANFNGAASLQIVTNDLGNTGGAALTDSDTINITVTSVNDPPVNTVPGVQTTNQGVARVFSTANGNAISISDVDAGASPVQVSLIATNGTVTLSGLAGLSFSTGDGTADTLMTFTGTIASINAALNGLSFTPNAPFSGAATLQIVTNDQGNTGGAPQTDTDSVTINVLANNQAPVNTLPAGPLTTNEDTALPIAGVSIADADAGGSSVRVTLTVTNGTLTITTAGLTFNTGDGTNDATMTFTGTIGAINTALGNLVYTPAANFSGEDTLTILTNDLGNTGVGGPKTDEDSVTITVQRLGGIVAVGSDAGTRATVKVFDPETGARLFEFQPYAEFPKFQGGVRVAVADANGDLVPDIVTISGAGIVTEIRVFSGVDGSRLIGHALDGVKPYGAVFNRGGFLALGDINGDTVIDAVVGPQAAGGGLVRVINGQTGLQAFQFRPFAVKYAQGIQVAVGNVVSATPALEIVVAPTKPLPKPRPVNKVPIAFVRVVAANATGTGAVFLRNIVPFANYRAGLNIAVGNLDGAGGDEIIVGSEAGLPRVAILSGDNGARLRTLTNADLGFAPAYRGPVRVAAGRVDDDAFIDLLVAPGRGDSPDLRAFKDVLAVPVKIVDFQPQEGFNGFWMGAS